jgi:simple sugar transport system ATP-binding protein
VQAAGPGAPAATLSGGNQQKLVVARALELAPRVLVAENPTRGLDIGAAAALHARIRAAADAGAGVLAHASDLDEVMEHSDRILVLTAGTVRAAPAGASRELVGRMMVGAE